jgi:para-nitrobenzyl esterase
MRLAAVLLLLLTGACATHPGDVDHVRFARDRTFVQARTETGLVRGVEGAGVRAFLGVPFAAAPVGERRFRAPGPLEPWRGVRDATRLGDDCIQAIGRRAILGGGGGIVLGKEDCLVLNIYSPAGPGPWPVMVYIPGGAFTVGSAANYDPSLLAKEQGRVVVTVNYRLGALGWLATPDMAAEGETPGGEFGLLDQQAALAWVQRNISGFGGDPGDVTLMAESAGAWSACYLMASPRSERLFHRVILQSGGCLEPSSLVSAEAAAADGVRFAEGLGCVGPGAAACLRRLPAWRIARAASTRSGINGPGSWGPVFGGAVAPESPAEAFAAGRFVQVPAIVGANADEGRLFAVEVRNEERYRKETIWMYGEAEGPRVLQRYPRAPEEPGLTMARSFTDQRFACPSDALRRLLARHVPVWGYEFADPDAPTRIPSWLAGYDMGAYHASELTYLFGRSWALAPARFTPEQAALARRMRDRWAGFGHRDFDGWTPVSDGGGPVLVMTPEGDRIDPNYHARRECDFWDGTPFGAVQP